MYVGLFVKGLCVYQSGAPGPGGGAAISLLLWPHISPGQDKTSLLVLAFDSVANRRRTFPVVL